MVDACARTYMGALIIPPTIVGCIIPMPPPAIGWPILVRMACPPIIPPMPPLPAPPIPPPAAGCTLPMFIPPSMLAILPLPLEPPPASSTHTRVRGGAGHVGQAKSEEQA